MQKYIATGCLDKVVVNYVTPNPTWISSLLLWYLFILNFMNLSWQTWYLFFFCKIVINKIILVPISLSNRSCPYEFNASIDCWFKTTSHCDVIAPPTVSTPRMLNCYQVPTCAILRCFVMWQDHSTWGSVKHFGDPPVLVESSRLRRNWRSWRKWIRLDPP